MSTATCLATIASSFSLEARGTILLQHRDASEEYAASKGPQPSTVCNQCNGERRVKATASLLGGFSSDAFRCCSNGLVAFVCCFPYALAYPASLRVFGRRTLTHRDAVHPRDRPATRLLKPPHVTGFTCQPRNHDTHKLPCLGSSKSMAD